MDVDARGTGLTVSCRGQLCGMRQQSWAQARAGALYNQQSTPVSCLIRGGWAVGHTDSFAGRAVAVPLGVDEALSLLCQLINICQQSPDCTFAGRAVAVPLGVDEALSLLCQLINICQQSPDCTQENAISSLVAMLPSFGRDLVIGH